MTLSLVNARQRVLRTLLPVLVMALAGCSSGTPKAEGGRCSDANLAWAVGQPLDEATYGRLWRESGAGIANPVAPTSVPKRDTRTDRLRIYTDKENRVVSVKCE